MDHDHPNPALYELAAQARQLALQRLMVLAADSTDVNLLALLIRATASPLLATRPPTPTPTRNHAPNPPPAPTKVRNSQPTTAAQPVPSPGATSSQPVPEATPLPSNPPPPTPPPSADDLLADLDIDDLLQTDPASLTALLHSLFPTPSTATPSPAPPPPHAGPSSEGAVPARLCAAGQGGSVPQTPKPLKSPPPLIRHGKPPPASTLLAAATRFPP